MLVRRGDAEQRRLRLEQELARMVPMLKARGAQRVILFGSLAREEAVWPGDIDLIVVLETQQRFLDRLDEMYRLLDCPLALDLLVYTPEEFEQMQHTNPLIRRAVQEGRELHATDT